MKVIEYLKKFSFAELKTELEKLYINNECCGFYNFTIEQWNAIYNLFGYQKDVETANVIHLIDSWERSCPLIDMNCMVLPESKVYKLSLANSIWFKDDPRFQVEQSFLQTNADYYGADAYKAAFDEATRNDINNWVKEHTDGMIPEILDEIPEDAVMYLVNALAFDAEWQEIYEAHQVWEGEFCLEDGTPRTVDLMHSEENRYLEDELATGFIKYYKDKQYAFAALLPNEGVTVQEYVDSLTGEHLMKLLSNPEKVTVFATMPKFETEYSVEMSEALMEMGMTDAFDYRISDFSRLGTYDADGLNICINRVLHKTFISVSEKGTRAGAATAVEMVAEGALLIEDYKTVTLDRPFVYMLIDCQTNLPFFIGTMMDVG